MDVEEFKQKYEELKDNPMYKNFCSILDTKNQVLERMSKENQQLKEKLEASEKARKEAIKLINKVINMRKNGYSYEQYKKHLDEALKELDIDKGE